MESNVAAPTTLNVDPAMIGPFIFRGPFIINGPKTSSVPLRLVDPDTSRLPHNPVFFTTIKLSAVAGPDTKLVITPVPPTVRPALTDAPPVIMFPKVPEPTTVRSVLTVADAPTVKSSRTNIRVI